MMKTKQRLYGMAGMLILFIGVSLSTPEIAPAHCDTLAGTVVTDAKKSLEKTDVTPVLKWVKKEHEGEVQEAFHKTLAARKQGKEAMEIADMYFFETVVRLHRAGEGAPYTGLKQDEEIEPIVAAADKALENGSVDSLVKTVTDRVDRGIHERFAYAKEAKKHADENVGAGRNFVEAYVGYIHYVEKLYLDTEGHSVPQIIGKGQTEKHHHQ